MSRSVSASDSDARQSIDLDDRTEAALTERMTVLPEVRGSVRVVGENHNDASRDQDEYHVDTRGPACTCGDWQYRSDQLGDDGCKHVRRARFALGVEAIPAAAASRLDVDPLLGEHCDADLQFATADGGVVSAGSEVKPKDDVDDECACADLPDGVPCFDCYLEGDAEWED